VQPCPEWNTFTLSSAPVETGCDEIARGFLHSSPEFGHALTFIAGMPLMTLELLTRRSLAAFGIPVLSAPKAVPRELQPTKCVPKRTDIHLRIF
jgi:hypothetical protein